MCRRSWGAKIGEPPAAIEDDRRHGAERLDVVQNGGALACARHRRERRTDAGDAALAFERFQQRGYPHRTS